MCANNLQIVLYHAFGGTFNLNAINLITQAFVFIPAQRMVRKQIYFLNVPQFIRGSSNIFQMFIIIVETGNQRTAQNNSGTGLVQAEEIVKNVG